MNDVTDRFYANLFVTVAILFSDDENAMLLRKNLEAKDILRINMETLEIPFYSASFCENNNNDYLWKNYADNNKGICIEMDEKYLLKYVDRVVKENYEPIDENDQFKETSIIAKRKVEYNYPIDTFLKALEFTKQYCVLKEDINNPNEHSKICFQNWLNLTLSIFAGTIKADSFSKEDEIRLLFQNRYTEEYINKNSIFLLLRYNLTKSLKKLGIDKEIIDGNKRRMELNLDGIFNEKLIKSITVGDTSNCDIGKMKDEMEKAGLSNVLLKDRKGNIL